MAIREGVEMKADNDGRGLDRPRSRQGRGLRIRRLGVTWSTSLAVAIVLASMSPDSLADECYAVSLTAPLLWVTSGAVSPSGDSLLVPDQYRREVLEIALPMADQHGRGVLERAREPGRTSTRLAETLESASGPVNLVQPSKIHAIEGGYLLEDEKYPRGVGDDEIFHLNMDLAVESSIAIKGRLVEGDITLSAIYDWVPIGRTGSQILAFGDLKAPNSEISAFLRLHEDGSSEIYKDTVIADPDAPVIELYLKNISYLASLGEDAYILFLDEESRIGEVVPGISGIRNLSLPADFERSPILYRDPSLEGEAHRQATAQYQVMEATRMPIGLYGWRDYLYLLAKEEQRRFETIWWLVKLDPSNGSEQSRVRLPTTAAHLTVIPGDFWSLIEKGPVQGMGKRHAPRMNTSSMVFLPGQWLENPSTGRLGKFPAPDCVELVGN